jgi:DNA-binding transcriptional regulator YbjK
VEAPRHAVLTGNIDPVTARGVHALIEGLIMHTILSAQPMTRADTTYYVERVLGAAAMRKPAARRS